MRGAGTKSQSEVTQKVPDRMMNAAAAASLADTRRMSASVASGIT